MKRIKDRLDTVDSGSQSGGPRSRTGAVRVALVTDRSVKWIFKIIIVHLIRGNVEFIYM